MDLFKEILDTKTSSSSPRFRMQMADLATRGGEGKLGQRTSGLCQSGIYSWCGRCKDIRWIRVLHGYAGKGFRLSYALPEIGGGEVLVGFIVEDMKCGSSSAACTTAKTHSRKRLQMKRIQSKRSGRRAATNLRSQKKRERKALCKTPGGRS